MGVWAYNGFALSNLATAQVLQVNKSSRSKLYFSFSTYSILIAFTLTGFPFWTFVLQPSSLFPYTFPLLFSRGYSTFRSQLQWTPAKPSMITLTHLPPTDRCTCMHTHTDTHSHTYRKYLFLWYFWKLLFSYLSWVL